MTTRPYKSDAEKFLVWREGTATDWQCTLAELFDATGLPVDRVKEICKASRWTLHNLDTGDASDNEEIEDVCTSIERGELDVS